MIFNPFSNESIVLKFLRAILRQKFVLRLAKLFGLKICKRPTIRLHLISIFLIFFVMGFVQISDGAGLATAVSVDLNKDIPVDRWYLEDRPPSKWGPGRSLRALQKIRWAEMNKKWVECARLARQSQMIPSVDKDWLWIAELRCLQENLRVNKKQASELTRTLRLAARESSGRKITPAKRILTQELISSKFALLNSETDIRKKWFWVNELLGEVTDLSSKQRALVLQTAGDLLLAEKQVDPALVYYERSLNVESNSQLQKTFERLLAERSQSEKQGLSVRPESGGESTGAGDAGAQSAIVGNESNDFTPSEAQQWLEQFKQSMAQGDFQEGLRWAGQLLERYPGSQMASWTRDKMYGLLRAVLKKKNVEEPHVSAWLKEAKKLDVSFLLVWIKSMHFSAYYNQGLELCSAGIDRWEKSPQLPVLAYWCGRMARNSDRMTEAQKYFELTIQSGPGTQLAKESGLFLGLIFYRQKKWKEAQEALAAVMSEAWDDDELECATRYWRWRSLQKMGPSEKERAQQVATELMERHPLRYYGLRARWESGQFNKNWLGLKESSVAPPKESLQIWMSESERGHWARLQLYLKAGWIEAAVSEWESIGFMGGREGRLFSAAVEAALFRFPQAMSLAAGLLKENEIQWRGYLLSIMFPREYSATIAEFSEHFRVDKTLIHSLVKQESAYNRTAKSHAQALGLMQLIPPTAREVAKNLRLKNLEIPEDLFQVRTNVRFGTYYLGRMLRFSNGHVPIALAAYNAGLGRIGRWLESRPALQGLREVRSSSPDDEVWIDEIPWGETRSYVKLILRNLIMYRAIYNKNVALEDIIWETGPASANSVRN